MIISNVLNSWERFTPREEKTPALIKLSTQRLFTSVHAVRSQKSPKLLNGPFSSRSFVMRSTT